MAPALRLHGVEVEVLCLGREDVQEDGADAGDLVDPVVEAVFHPATASGNRLKGTPKDEEVFLLLRHNYSNM